MMQMSQRQEGSPRRVGRGAGEQGQRGSQDEEADQVSPSVAIAVEEAREGWRGEEDACPQPLASVLEMSGPEGGGAGDGSCC